MTNTDTRDIDATVSQIHRLEEAGCEIIRCAVPDEIAANALGEIKKRIKIPLIADIHFNYKLALIALEKGVDCLRLNPGNIGSEERIKMVVEMAKEKQIPIRIGINGGSLESDLLAKYKHPTPEAMLESALRHIRILEKLNYQLIKISLKSTNIHNTLLAYQLLAKECNYPFHIGITEAGTYYRGLIKSSIGIGALLLAGLGDTLRVSLTADPIEEVRAGFQILQSLGLRQCGVDIISCPTCGRCEVDLFSIVDEVERRSKSIKEYITIAVMGCIVNGPGEAREADVGIACGRGVGIIFRNGEQIKKVQENQLVDALFEEIEKIILV